MLSDISYSSFYSKAKSLGYEVSGDVDSLAIVGWRNRNARVNKFDCFLSVYEIRKSKVIESVFPITTYPGLPYMLKPLVPEGVATLVPGQYVNAYGLGNFKGKTVLRQVGSVSVFRDNNKDAIRNLQYISTGLFGIHIHAAGKFSSIVGHWSAGCQVFQKQKDFDTFICACETYKEKLSNKFTYTLMEF